MLLPDSINIALEVEKYLIEAVADADDDLITLDNIVLLILNICNVAIEEGERRLRNGKSNF